MLGLKPNSISYACKKIVVKAKVIFKSYQIIGWFIWGLSGLRFRPWFFKCLLVSPTPTYVRRTFIHPYSTYLEKLGLSWANKSRKSFSINKIVKFAVFQWSDVTSIHFSLGCSDIFMQRPRLFLSSNFYSPSKLFQIDVCNCKKAVIHEFIHFWFHFP